MKKLFLYLFLTLSLVATAFTRDDTHFWVGDGNAFCYFVIDWYGEAKVWTYRWWSADTAPTVFDALKRIDHEDHRLTIAHQPMTSSFVDIYFMGYDVNDSSCVWDAKNGGASDPEALVGLEDSVYYSQWWVFYGPIDLADYATTNVYSSLYAANSVQVANGKVYLFTIGSPEYDSSWNESPIIPPTPTAAESPYGWRVADSNITTTTANFKVPSNVLHRPTCYMRGTWGGPVTPYNPAWMAGELLTLNGEGDYVTIEFDHPVLDDPNNPWGIDLLVFGNSFGVGKKKDYYEETSDPGNWEFTGEPSAEPALVEVSADGINWFSYENGPFCDDWAPTQGIIYDKANADTNWFAGNKWWSVTTDATWPINPSTTWDDITGQTIETLSCRYDTSAGGAGFDIGAFALPTNSAGVKYIKYVRVSAYYDEEEDEWTMPEVDAVSDVRPATPYEQWKIANYTDWHTAWNTNLTGKTVLAANGLPNCVNQVLGLSASQSPDISSVTGGSSGGSGSSSTEDVLAFELIGLSPSTNYTDLFFRSLKVLGGNCGITAKRATALDGTWTDELPSFQGAEDLGDGTYKNVFRVSNEGSFFKISIGE